jgi:hypothetical protein
MLSLGPSFGRFWNHELAEICARQHRSRQVFFRMGDGLIPSVGRSCEMGSISWPRLHSDTVGLQTMAANDVSPFRHWRPLAFELRGGP